MCFANERDSVIGYMKALGYSVYEPIYARIPEITEPLEAAILRRDGIPYLSPEFGLLCKSTDTER